MILVGYMPPKDVQFSANAKECQVMKKVCIYMIRLPQCMHRYEKATKKFFSIAF